MATKVSLQATQTAAVPAKLNLFLHVTGQRPDGYHLLESVFVAIDWYDTLAVTVDDSGQIQRTGDIDWPHEKDLAVRAAQALYAQGRNDGRLPAQAGCQLMLKKAIPHGAGLGGGSADAAYTLRLLNALWQLNYPTDHLAAIGLGLGADVPFFLGPPSAHVRGIGEEIVHYPMAAQTFVVVVPPVQVPTAAIFRDPGLVRSTPSLPPEALREAATAPVWTLGHNDLQTVACRQFPAIAQYLSQMQDCASSLGLPREACRMSGSGSALFVSCADRPQAETLATRLSAQFKQSPGGPPRGHENSLQSPSHTKESPVTIRVCHRHF